MRSRRSDAGRAKLSLEIKKLEGKLNGPIPPEQWKLPAGYKEDEESLANLEEMANPEIPTLSLSDVTEQQRKKVIISRLEQQPNFDISLMGAGRIKQVRAIKEVKADTAAGKVIQEIEQRIITNMMRKAMAEE
jgi:hypothetical protein